VEIGDLETEIGDGRLGDLETGDWRCYGYIVPSISFLS
jgi:hypothetical protein